MQRKRKLGWTMGVNRKGEVNFVKLGFFGALSFLLIYAQIRGAEYYMYLCT